MANFPKVAATALMPNAIAFSVFPLPICAATTLYLRVLKPSFSVVIFRFIGKELPYPAALPRGF